jgi:hypothetical protein
MLKQIDPKNISNTLKEAIADSLLGKIYQRVSGEDSYGEYVLNNRPSNKFVSGFIEPMYVANMGNRFVDPTTNPIHIITVGLDFQAKKSLNSEFSVKAKFSIYVRVLPTADEFKKFKVHMELANDVKRAIKNEMQKVKKQYELQNQSLLKSDKSKFYKQRQDELDKIVSNLLKNQFKVFLNDQNLNEKNLDVTEDELLKSSLLNDGETLDASLESSLPSEASEDVLISSGANTEFLAFPNMQSIIPDGVMERVPPLQKWFRLDIDDCPTFTIPVAINDTELERLIEKNNKILRQAVVTRVENWLKDTDPIVGGKLWAFPAGLRVTPNKIKHWDDTLKEIRKECHDKDNFSLFSLPNIDICWAIEITDQHDNPEVRIIRVSVENRTNTQRSNRTEIEESVFQVGLEVSIKSEFHSMLKLDRIKPSYRYNEYLNYPAMGVNNGVISTESDGVLVFKTTWMPIYAQPRIRPAQYNDVDVSFLSLQTDEGLRSLRELPKKFKNWIEETKKNVNPCADVIDATQKEVETLRFKEDLHAWDRESKKIEKGIDLLIISADAYKKNTLSREGIPFRAWCLMQKTMGIVSQQKGFKVWHLFQIAFILANLSGIVSRMNEFANNNYYDEEWDEAVSLLHFSTGGGKTESFFGLIIFNLFFDRLRGKSIGVTAMLRYPLRLLTTQQAQRLAITLAVAERIRWEEDIKGNPFEIGFWVGGGNTPNWRKGYSDAQVPVQKDGKEINEKDLIKNAEYTYAKEAWNKLPVCPFCKGKTVLRKYPKRNNLIGHACIEDNCDWNLRHGGTKKVALPFYIVDEDIYEVAPSIVLGTIDKLALIGQSPSTIRRFFGMFGFSPFYNEETGMLVTPNSPSNIDRVNAAGDLLKLSPFYEKGYSLFLDPFPSLIIQDEAHLLEESLGTFSGIFQTTFENVLKELGKHKRMQGIVSTVPDTNLPRMPKIIAASATVTEPERQMEAIYQRDAFQFPWPGPELYRSFYAAPSQREPNELVNQKDWNDEEMANRARFYASIMTNGKPHTSTAVEILANFHLIISQMMLRLNDENLSIRKIARKELMKGVMNTRLNLLYKAAIDKATDEEIAALIDIHRISLTYVTNKKGGDQIMAAESDTAVRIHEENDVQEFEGLNSKLISGAVSAGEIEAVIKQAEQRPINGEELSDIFDEDLTRSIVATSAISHGVDVNEFNSMFFAGMPSSVSEYIQASSRVGRTHVGFSLLVPTPQRRRDRYILEINDIYHRFLERLIRPAAVNRWAENALVRSMPSIFQAYLIGVIELSFLIDADDSEKSRIGDYEKIDKINSMISSIGNIKFKSQLENFVYDAVGLTHSKYAPSAAEQFKDILRHEALKNIVDDIIDNSDRYTTLRELFSSMDNMDKQRKRSPMTSLRDVDPLGNISFEKKGNLSVDSTNAYDIMRVISHHGSSSEG